MMKECLRKITEVIERGERERQRRFERGECFNVFEVLELEADEVRLHSAMIAELLNPSGSHGGKDKFLRLFLETVGLSDWDFETAQARAEKEKTIGLISKDGTRGGRLDIIVTDAEGRAVIIENKVFAQDQPKQLLRYANYAKENHPAGYRLLYLTLDGHEASDFSLAGADVEYSCISYKDDILPWLERCAAETGEQPAVRETIRQYITNLGTIMNLMSESEENDVLDIALADENINATLTLLANGDEIMTRIRERFIDELAARAEELGFVVNRDEGLAALASGKRWMTFSFPTVSDKWAFFLGYTRANSGLMYGISAYMPNNRARLAKAKVKMLEQVWTGNEQDGEWPLGWCYLWSESGKVRSGRWWDWNDPTVLTDMLNGRMLDFLVGQLEKVKTLRLIERVVEVEN